MIYGEVMNFFICDSHSRLMLDLWANSDDDFRPGAFVFQDLCNADRRLACEFSSIFYATAMPHITPFLLEANSCDADFDFSRLSHFDHLVLDPAMPTPENKWKFPELFIKHILNTPKRLYITADTLIYLKYLQLPIEQQRAIQQWQSIIFHPQVSTVLCIAPPSQKHLVGLDECAELAELLGYDAQRAVEDRSPTAVSLWDKWLLKPLEEAQKRPNKTRTNAGMVQILQC